MKPEGIFLASGIIDNRLNDVLEKMQERGLKPIQIIEESGWVLISFPMGIIEIVYR
jgi:ribosomal protein L11 methylase PrmA